jgi:dTDP-glucose pyrophosphorylase
MSIRDAVYQLNEVGKCEGGRGFHFLVLVDNDGRLIGTLSDGDLRRGIIAGISINEAVERVACLSPVYGSVADPVRNLAKLKGNIHQANYLPVVDDKHVVCNILVLAEPTSIRCSVLIMAGGFGKRLGNLTRNTPKPLLHIGNRPILSHILERVNIVSPESIYISVHYLSDQIANFASIYPEAERITLLHEDVPLGTAGALGLLPQPFRYPLIICNGDVLTSLNFGHFLRFFQEQDFDAIIAVAHYSVVVPYGVVRYSETGEFLGIREKPTLDNFVSAGIYILSPLFVSLVSQGEVLDMPDLIVRGQGLGLRIGIFPLHEYWTDIGQPECFDNAERNINQNTG